MRKTRVSVLVGVVLLTAMSGLASAQAWRNISEDAHRRSAEQFRGRSVCGDFWIDYAISAVSGGIDRPSGGDCDIQNYGGHWSSLTELIGYVDCYKRNGSRSCFVDYYMRVSPAGSDVRVQTVVNGRVIGTMMVDARTKLVKGTCDGACMVAAGGGNMVAAGGGNLDGRQAASVLPSGAGGLVGNSGNTYTIQSVQEIRIGRGLLQYGAAVRGKEQPNLELKIGEEKLLLVGAVPPLENKEKK